MKNIAVVMAILGSLLIRNGSAAEPAWVKAAWNNEITASFDGSRINKNGLLLNIWVLFDNKEPHVIAGKASSSFVMNADVDCGIKTYRDRGTYNYASAKGTGTLVASFPEEEKSQAAPPNSLIEGVIIAACAYAHAKDSPPPVKVVPPKPKLPLKPANPF